MESIKNEFQPRISADCVMGKWMLRTHQFTYSSTKSAKFLVKKALRPSHLYILSQVEGCVRNVQSVIAYYRNYPKIRVNLRRLAVKHQSTFSTYPIARQHLKNRIYLFQELVTGY
jgi:hypothetical protein